ncbi:unnamed protein product [Rhizophagus irregularis]|nr:unnamed protein product [Rhizophagus irregularis]
MGDNSVQEMTRILAETKLGNEEFLFKLTEESFREQSSELNYNHEGIDSLSVIPDERLERIYKWLLKNPIALLRSPPGSDCNLFYSIWNKYKNEATIEHLMTVIIDKSQILYDNVDTFWNDLKGLQQTEIKRTFLHVLLLNMYGEKRGNEGHEMVATPICFNATLGLSDLLLPKNEYEDLVDRWVKTETRDGPVNFSEKIKTSVFNITQGHIYLVRHILRALQYEYRRGHCKGDNSMLEFLVSVDFRNKVITTRPFDWMFYWSPTADELEFLRNAYYHA